MKRILLTGVGGSIGIHTLAHIMHNTDWEVVGTDSFRHKGWSDRITEMFKEHEEWKERFTLITHDLTAPFSDYMKRKIGKIDIIISMASLSDVDVSIENPREVINNNINVVINLLEYAREIKPEAFVQISTDEVYGASDGIHGHKEWSPIIPSNPYSASKACQEAIAISYWRTYGVPVIITNTMNNFGEMQQSKKYPAVLQKLIESESPVTVYGEPNGDIGTRFYIHSRNHSDAILFILKSFPPYVHKNGEADMPDRYNIVGDVQLNNLQFAEVMAKLMDKSLYYEVVDFHTIRPGHDKHYGLDGTKLRELGWVSPMSFEESLARTIEWQREHPEWLI